MYNYLEKFKGGISKTNTTHDADPKPPSVSHSPVRMNSPPAVSLRRVCPSTVRQQSVSPLAVREQSINSPSTVRRDTCRLCRHKTCRAQFFGLAGVHLHSHQVNVVGGKPVSYRDLDVEKKADSVRALVALKCSAAGFLMWTEGRQQSSVKQQMFYTAAVTLISWAESSSLYETSNRNQKKKKSWALLAFDSVWDVIVLPVWLSQRLAQVCPPTGNLYIGFHAKKTQVLGGFHSSSRGSDCGGTTTPEL
ncbi:hypothetical protein NQZ68_022260 [Dissostichus eleginoides]|nr:hypothetical protein NQZ68_022260 [Dissostichus eleginoides]